MALRTPLSPTTLQAQINALLAQIAALQGNTGTTASVSFSRDLTLGATGSDVTALQNWLISKGYAISAGATGYFGVQTQAAVAKYQAANGIAPAAGYFGPTTRAHVNAASAGTGTGTGTGTGSTTGALKGGAGDLEQVDTKDDTENTVGEGKEENVTSVTFEADGSDIALTNIRVLIDNPLTTGSNRLEKYVDEVVVYLDGKEVGSVDVADFNRNGTEYTRNIALSKAVIEDGEEGLLSLGFKAVNTVDTTGKTWRVEIQSVRFEDATGAVITQNVTGTQETVTFVSGTADDGLEVRKSSDSPRKSSLKVETDKKSDSFHLLTAELTADDDGADVDVLYGTVTLTIAGTAPANIDSSMIDEVVVKHGRSSYRGKLNATTSTSVAYNIDFKSGITVDAGDTEEVEVFVTLKKSSGFANATGLDVKFQVTEAESTDEVLVTGSAETTGFTLSGATASSVDGAYSAPKMSSDGNSTISNGYIAVVFEAGDDLDGITFSSLANSTPAAGKIVYTISGGTATGTPAVYEGGKDSIGDADDKLVASTDKFVKGREYVVVVDLSNVAGGQNRPTIEITNINNKAVTGIKYVASN